MKVLFLDIDGVINSERTCELHHGYPHSFGDHDMKRFDPVAIGLIRRVLEETESVVVVSSTWRMHYSCEEISEGLGIPVLDRTCTGKGLRGEEVKQWLDENTEKHSVTKYAIIDDNSDFLEEQKPFFVQTDYRNGLMYQDFEKLFELLSDEQPIESALELPAGVKFKGHGITVSVVDSDS